MIERRRLPSASYHSPIENEPWSRCQFAEQPVVIIGESRDATQIARHVPGASPFFVMDMPSVMARVDDWQDHLPRVQAYYALRCNADPVLARMLADCAQLGFAVSDALELVPADRIIMDCPLWTRKAMRIAGECGVGTIVIDNEKQLMDAISYADSLMAEKGAQLEEVEGLLMTAFELRAKVVGIRYFAAAAFVLCTSVIGKQALEARFITKDDFDDGVGFVYQTNDSVYGSFGCVLMNAQPECIPLDVSEIADAPQHFGTVLGASLQPGDVAQSLIRCRQLCVGDWLLWRDAGAYTMPLDSEHAVPPVYYYAGSDEWLSDDPRLCQEYPASLVCLDSLRISRSQARQFFTSILQKGFVFVRAALGL
ncbi:unnamed protein product [Heligmosomoides polygyrus]|uniref:Orn_Arg_deC_N domain-containing protein n=1 Tax=Heligmosomoides polygyrus TaxID=6339 RepID=A0A3P8BH18_HELPZ|nr:unnamed protein product [Heligmosomoides polygyrus]